MTPKKDEYMRGYGDGFKDAAQATVKVKPLVWDETEENWHTATTPFSYGYEVRRTDRGAIRWRCGGRPFDNFDGSFDEAKAFAQGHFEAAIRSLIVAAQP